MTKQNKKQNQKIETKNQNHKAEEIEMETQEIEIQYSANGFVIWKTEDGIISGLSKKDFLAEIPADDNKLKKQATSEFYLYRAESAKIRLANLEERVESEKQKIVEYTKQAELALKEPSEKEKRLMAIEAYEKKIAKLKAELEEEAQG